MIWLDAEPTREGRIEQAARALLEDVRRRYPGEALRCPYMIELDAALQAKSAQDHD